MVRLAPYNSHGGMNLSHTFNFDQAERAVSTMDRHVFISLGIWCELSYRQNAFSSMLNGITCLQFTKKDYFIGLQNNATKTNWQKRTSYGIVNREHIREMCVN